MFMGSEHATPRSPDGLPAVSLPRTEVRILESDDVRGALASSGPSRRLIDGLLGALLVSECGLTGPG